MPPAASQSGDKAPALRPRAGSRRLARENVTFLISGRYGRATAAFLLGIGPSRSFRLEPEGRNSSVLLDDLQAVHLTFLLAEASPRLSQPLHAVNHTHHRFCAA